MKNGLFATLGVFALSLAATSAAHAFYRMTYVIGPSLKAWVAGYNYSGGVSAIIGINYACAINLGVDCPFSIEDPEDPFAGDLVQPVNLAGTGVLSNSMTHVAVYDNWVNGDEGAHAVYVADTAEEARNGAKAACEVRNQAALMLDSSLTCQFVMEFEDVGEDTPPPFYLQRVSRFSHVGTNPVITDSEFDRSLSGESDNGGGGAAVAIIGGVAVVGGLIWLLSDGGEEGTVSFSPDFDYSATESGYSANAGGRMDFRKDRWHLYYTASQTNANGDFGDFRYSSGGKWQGDIFAAAFSEKVSGETADYDVSLSANWTGGIWKVSPAFAIDSVYEKGEFATTNSFRINGEMRYDDWRFSASGDKTQMNLSAVLEF